MTESRPGSSPELSSSTLASGDHSHSQTPRKRRPIEYRSDRRGLGNTCGAGSNSRVRSGDSGASTPCSLSIAFANAKPSAGGTAFPIILSTSEMLLPQNWYDNGKACTDAHSRAVKVRMIPSEWIESRHGTRMVDLEV